MIPRIFKKVRIPILLLPIASLAIVSGVALWSYTTTVEEVNAGLERRKNIDAKILRDLLERTTRNEFIPQRQISAMRSQLEGRHENTLVLIFINDVLVIDNRQQIKTRFDPVVEALAKEKISPIETTSRRINFEHGQTQYYVVAESFFMARNQYVDVILVTNLNAATAPLRRVQAISFVILTLTIGASIAALTWLVVMPIRRTRRAIADSTKLPSTKGFYPVEINGLIDAANQYRADAELSKTLIDISPNPILICRLPRDGEEAIVVFANPATKSLGYENLVGEPLNKLMAPEYWDYHTWRGIESADLGRTVGMGSCPYHAEFNSRVIDNQRSVPVLTANKEELQMLLSVKTLKTEDDGSRNFCGTLQDVTELVVAKAEIERINHIAAHDIKADLTALNKASDIILETVNELLEYLNEKENLLDEVLLDALDTIKTFSELNINSSRNAFDVLDQRNKLFDLESKIVIAPCKVSDVVDAMRAAFSTEQGTFEIVNHCKEGKEFLADSSLFLSVLKNIVRNGFIHNDSPLKKVSIAIAEDGDFVEFTTTDNGVGIPQKYLKNWGSVIGKQAQLGNRGGSGTGLYSIKTIMNAHRVKTRSTVEIESTMGVGTSFILRMTSA